MLAIYHVSRIDGLDELWIRKENDIYIPCHRISRFITSQHTALTTSLMLTTYSLTGCDSVSYIFSCGKKKALKITLECNEILKPLAEYRMPGSGTEISADVLEASVKFVFTVCEEGLHWIIR